MSWASRRRTMYIIGTTLFVGAVVAIPVVNHFNQPPSCTDGVKNQGETAPDRGGPCPLLDESLLAQPSVLWARSFKVRDGAYNAVAYVENTNKEAGVRIAHYRFSLYDSGNIFVAERVGTMFIMPGAITPVFDANIDTGNRDVAHTYFELTSPVTWERLTNEAGNIDINNRQTSDMDTAPRVEAIAENTSVKPLSDITFVAVLFSVAGNARAASQTALQSLAGGEKQSIIFTWPQPIDTRVGRVDILPLIRPATAR